MTDEELQCKIENNEYAGNSADVNAYRTVFDALGKENFTLSSGFADSVVQRLHKRTSQAKEHLWLSVGLASLLMTGAGTAIALGFKINFGAFKFISGYAGLFIFAAAFIVALNWVDKNLLQKITAGNNGFPDH